jgi:hypothetical protein
LFIIELVLSGAAAIPLPGEVNLVLNFLGAGGKPSEPVASLLRAQGALVQTQAQHPFLFYGTDWPAFGHLVIAIACIGALRDPVRNRWLFDFGLIACTLVIPYALVLGGLRGIPFGWRLIDCSFGVLGFIPLWFCRKWTNELEEFVKSQTSPAAGRGIRATMRRGPDLGRPYDKLARPLYGFLPVIGLTRAIELRAIVARSFRGIDWFA